MKSTNSFRSLGSLIVIACLLVVPVSAFSKKGKEHFDRGMKAEQEQQWEKAAQEFTLAVAADPSNVNYQLHYRRAVFSASQMFMQQGRALAEQRDYAGAYNAFRQAFGYDPVNQVAVSEMERMLRLQAVKEGTAPATTGAKTDETENQGTPPSPSAVRQQEAPLPQRPEAVRVINYSGDLKSFIRTLAGELNLNVVFDRQSFSQPRPTDVNLRDVTTAKALDYIFMQEGLFFQKLDRHTILVADQGRRAQYQQLVMRTFYLANMKPADAKTFIGQAIPASVGRPNMVVVPDDATNSITVRDTAENVRLIGDLINGIDKDRAEVVMDVNIYEVSKSNLLQLGNQIGTPGTNGTFNLGGSPGLSVLTSNGALNPTTAGVLLNSITGGVPTAAAAALVIPSSVLTAFQSKNNGRLIASTKVHAFNGEESKARIGQRVPVQTAQAYPFGIQTGTPNPQSGSVFPTGGFPVINYEPTGLTLSFTPTVFPNLDVQVKMNIESKDVTGANTLTPTFTERTISGTARVQNNRTMLLASVSQDVQSNGRQGLPFLGGLPLVGRLFSSPTRDDRQVDIVIAVTPQVLRAPAVTPRDEEERQSGTTMSPTNGSLEAMLRETAREDQIAAARQIPREVNVQLPDAAPAYVPAPTAQIGNQSTLTDIAANVSNAVKQPVTQLSPAGNQTPAINKEVPTTQTRAETVPAKTTPVAMNNTSQNTANLDSSMPAPKSANQALPDSTSPQPIDVSTAVKNLISSGAATNSVADTKQNASVQPAVESLSPKSDAATMSSHEPAAALAELKFLPGKNEMAVGEKQQLAIQLNTSSPLGLAVVMLRFDPRVIKINSLTPGTAFADAKTAPTITRSIDQNGMLLISITPAAPVSGAGSLLNLEVEALAAGDSTLKFDLANMHVVASDGRSPILQIEPIKLTVK
jgi:general secretion pathway protein D